MARKAGKIYGTGTDRDASMKSTSVMINNNIASTGGGSTNAGGGGGSGSSNIQNVAKNTNGN